MKLIRSILFCSLLFVGGATAAGAQSLRLWLDAGDPSTITTASGVVQQWRDKSGNGHHLIWANGSPRVLPTGGIELVERSNGVDDALLNTDQYVANNESYLVIVTFRPYQDAQRIIATGSNNLSLLIEPGQRSTFQTNNDGSCSFSRELPTYNNVEVWAARRLMRVGGRGAGTDNTFFRFGHPPVNGSPTCFVQAITNLKLENGTGSFPTNPTKGMVAYEILIFAAPMPTSAAAGIESSPLDDDFVLQKMTETAERWADPVPVMPSTWSRIKMQLR